MRIIFMGTPDFAVPVLESLIKGGHTIEAVYTNPDKPKGRTGTPAFSPVKSAALKYNLPVMQPERIRRKEEVEKLRLIEADAIVVAAFGQIIPKSILSMKKFGCINVHGSLLPKYRGAAPIQWSILNGEEKTGITIMQMNEGLDTGDILSQEEVEILDTDTSETLFQKLSECSGPLLLRTLKDLEEGRINPIPQPEISPTPYASMLTKEMGLLDFTMTSSELKNRIRAFNPWPAAYTYYNGMRIKILKAEILSFESANLSENVSASHFSIGQVSYLTKNDIGIQCSDGILLLREIQPEGKRTMQVRDFLNGQKIDLGDRFGE